MIPEKCYFRQMVHDSRDYIYTLQDKFMKWQKKIANDSAFTFHLCNLLYEESKFYAIPQILRVSKYKLIIENFIDMSGYTEIIKTSNAAKDN